jgi:hypothetical protein
VAYTFSFDPRARPSEDETTLDAWEAELFRTTSATLIALPQEPGSNETWGATLAQTFQDGYRDVELTSCDQNFNCPGGVGPAGSHGRMHYGAIR